MKIADAEQKVAKLIDWVWKIELESGGKQRARLLPMMALLATHRVLQKLKRVRGKR